MDGSGVRMLELQAELASSNAQLQAAQESAQALQQQAAEAAAEKQRAAKQVRLVCCRYGA